LFFSPFAKIQGFLLTQPTINRLACVSFSVQSVLVVFVQQKTFLLTKSTKYIKIKLAVSRVDGNGRHHFTAGCFFYFRSF